MWGKFYKSAQHWLFTAHESLIWNSAFPPDSCWSTVWPPTHLEMVPDVTTWPALSSPFGRTRPPPSPTTQRRGSTRRRRRQTEPSRRRTATTAKRLKVTKGTEEPSQREQLDPGNPETSETHAYLTNIVSPETPAELRPSGVVSPPPSGLFCPVGKKLLQLCAPAFCVCIRGKDAGQTIYH